jgi:cytoskeletal protein CcmA (bactofilin family)
MLMRSAPVQANTLANTLKTRTVGDLPAGPAATNAAPSMPPALSVAGRVKPAMLTEASSPVASTSAAGRSVIGQDLTIIGQGLKIVSAGSLQIDGKVQGDVQGADVIVGVTGRVTGTVAGGTVVVRGAVEGVIRGQQVTLEDKSRVEGDIHHQALSILPGAEFEGRSRRTRPGETFDLAPGVESDQPNPGSLS